MALVALYTQYQQQIQRKRILLEAGPTTSDAILNSMDFFLMTVIEELNEGDADDIIAAKNDTHNIDDEMIHNAGLKLMNENVYIEHSYKLKFRSYIHHRYSKRLIDKERGYWEILNDDFTTDYFY